MGTAIAGGLVRSDVFKADEMSAFDVNDKAASAFTSATKIKCVASPELGVADAEIVFLAIKPQMLDTALAPVAGGLSGKLVISIVAGVPLERLAAFNGEARYVRVMPNTPALVGAGISAYVPGNNVKSEDEDVVRRILGGVGEVVKVREAEMDAVTALSGSGPAYVFEFMRALSDGGVAEGLSRETADRLALVTVLGSAKMALDTGTHVAVLRDQVTSPAGTTIAALAHLEEHAFGGTVLNAVRAAAKRSRELGKK